MNEKFEYHIKKLIKEINIYLFIVIFLSIILIGFTLRLLMANSQFSIELFIDVLIGFVLFILYYFISTVKGKYLYMLENYHQKNYEITTMLRRHLNDDAKLFKNRLAHIKDAYNALMKENKK